MNGSRRVMGLGHRGQTLFAFGILLAVSIVLSLMTSACESKLRRESERMWGSERVCLPCHAYRLPIARNHNYRCDTCHAGQPYAKDKDVAHKDLFPHPQ